VDFSGFNVRSMFFVYPLLNKLIKSMHLFDAEVGSFILSIPFFYYVQTYYNIKVFFPKESGSLYCPELGVVISQLAHREPISFFK
jgi:hypothetical protein